LSTAIFFLISAWLWVYQVCGCHADAYLGIKRAAFLAELFLFDDVYKSDDAYKWEIVHAAQMNR